MNKNLLGQHARLVFVLLVISELNLDLEGTKLNCSLKGHGMGSIQDSLLGLLVQEVELDRVPIISNKNLILEYFL